MCLGLSQTQKVVVTIGMNTNVLPKHPPLCVASQEQRRRILLILSRRGFRPLEECCLEENNREMKADQLI